MGVKPIVEYIGSDDIIQVIPWRLDNQFLIFNILYKTIKTWLITKHNKKEKQKLSYSIVYISNII